MGQILQQLVLDVLIGNPSIFNKDLWKENTLISLDGANTTTTCQTWNLSKNLHRRIFRLQILHRQFHLILTVLVRENTKNE